MNSIKALSIISGISLAGILFSGYLTLGDISKIGAATCSLGGCQMILGLPTCMYGLAMYIAVFVISLLGRKQ